MATTKRSSFSFGSQYFPLSLSHKFYCCQENFTLCVCVCVRALPVCKDIPVATSWRSASGLQTLIHIRNLLYLFGERFILMFQIQHTLLTGFQTPNFRDSSKAAKGMSAWCIAFCHDTDWFWHIWDFKKKKEIQTHKWENTKHMCFP